MHQGTKRARTTNPGEPTTHAVEPTTGRPQLLLVKTELQSWLGKKYCDEAELLPLLLAHSIVRRVHTIEVEVRSLGGDSFKVGREEAFGERGESRNRLRTGNTRGQGQARAIQSGDQDRRWCSTRGRDAEPELLGDNDMELKNGEIVAMAVKEDVVFDPLHAEEERTLEGHTNVVKRLAF
jgi:hypothetical protein